MADNRATATKFNNVTSLGVAYSWENGNHGNPCTGLLGGEALSTGKWIKRTKQVSLDVRNLDITEEGISVVSGMAVNQDKYTNTKKTRIYANGNYMGEGRLSDYSITEGSQSNDVTTSLSYTMPDGGPDDTTSLDEEDDPISWSSSITVKRDIKGKSYSIEQNASVNFGNDFDLITNHPLYVDDPEYASVAGRLAKAENWANNLIFTDQIDYNDYIDLSAYQTEAGWNLAVLAEGESGVKSSSSFTKDFVNGNYSSSRTTNLVYTGEDVTTRQTPYYDVTYTISLQSAKGEGGRNCTTAKLQGNVNGVGGNGVNNAQAATSGYNNWVASVPSSTTVQAFFTAAATVLGSDFYGSLNSTVKNLISTQCETATNQGGRQNNGNIAFSLEMDNCPDGAASTSYTSSESITTKESKMKCKGQVRTVIETTVAGKIQGQCGLQLDSNGGNPRWENVEGDFNSAKDDAKTTAEGDYTGPYPTKNKIKSESYSYNAYGANGDYSVVYSDAPWKRDCSSRTFDGCYAIETVPTSTASVDNVIRTLTNAGWVSEVKGKSLPTKSVKTTISSATTGDCAKDYQEFLNKAKEELNNNKPNCVLTDLSWTFAKEYEAETVIDASSGGVDL